MKVYPLARRASGDLITSIDLENFQVSWAGGCPSNLGNFCFGSEDGHIMFTNSDGFKVAELKEPCTSGEAVNGVAFIQNWMSVTSRKEITLSHLVPDKGFKGAAFPIGAHGVVAGGNSFFFAPAGPAGMVFFRPAEVPEQNATISDSEAEPINVYHLITLQSSTGQEVIACACRQKGIGVMEFMGEDQPHKLNTMTFDGVDLIDLCPLNNSRGSLAVAAVSKDGAFHLFHNLLRDRNAKTIKFQTIQGTAYRLFSARGYLFLLTNVGLYVIAGLVDHFLKGSPGNPDVHVLPLPMEAVDANLASDDWVLIIMPDGVLRLDIRLLDQSSPTSLNDKVREPRPIVNDAIWSRHGIPQHSSPMLVKA